MAGRLGPVPRGKEKRVTLASPENLLVPPPAAAGKKKESSWSFRLIIIARPEEARSPLDRTSLYMAVPSEGKERNGPLDMAPPRRKGGRLIVSLSWDRRLFQPPLKGEARGTFKIRTCWRGGKVQPRCSPCKAVFSDNGEKKEKEGGSIGIMTLSICWRWKKKE